MNNAIRIAILDAVPESYWADDHGITDSQKFIDLLQPLNAAARFDVFYTSKNQFPDSLDCYDAILLTGSPCSVHDDHDWIGKQLDLIRAAAASKLRLIGSCFGHQLVARAFGGAVGHNENGWVIGNFAVHIDQSYDWMQPDASRTSLYHFNRERVTRLPDGAQPFARTDEYADFGYTLGDNIMCFQGHPEQPRRAMVNFLRATDSLSQDEHAQASRHIDNGEPDAHIWAEWMMRFFLSGAKQRATWRL